MNPIKDELLKELEDTAMEGAKQLRAFFTYQGSDQVRFQKAKLGAAVISAYSRVRATEANRVALMIAAERMDGGTVKERVKKELGTSPEPKLVKGREE